MIPLELAAPLWMHLLYALTSDPEIEVLQWVVNQLPCFMEWGTIHDRGTVLTVV